VQLVSPNNTSIKQQKVYSSLFYKEQKTEIGDYFASLHGQDPAIPISTFTCMLSRDSIFYLPSHPSFSYSLSKGMDHPMVLMGLSSSHLHCPSLNLRMVLGPFGRLRSEMGADLLLMGNFYPTCEGVQYKLRHI